MNPTEVGPTSEYLCQALEIPLCVVIGGAAARIGEIRNIETLKDLEVVEDSDITCFNQGIYGCDTDKRDGVADRIHILFLTGLPNFGERLRNNELNLCLHGCTSSVISRWNTSIPHSEKNFIELDPRVRHERESTTVPGKIRVNYRLDR